jgi:hypothetical protein
VISRVHEINKFRTVEHNRKLLNDELIQQRQRKILKEQQKQVSHEQN